MKSIKIFVEGESDKKFISDYIKHLEIDLSIIDFQIEKLNGKDDDKFQKNLPQFASSDKNLVIVDADDNFEERKSHLLALKTRLSIDYNIFLFPNNYGNGELETLLQSIIWDKYQGYFSCFPPFESCVKLAHSDFNPPSLKDKIYAYLSALLIGRETDQRSKYISPTNMEYMNERFWNINHSNLYPLKRFLIEHISGA